MPGQQSEPLTSMRMLSAVFGSSDKHCLSYKCRSEMNGWARSIHDRKIFNLISAIHAAPRQEWSLEQMAKQTHLSRSSFYRRFQDTVGDTPMNYVIEARVNAAAELLAITEKSIEQIAMDTGFKSSRALRSAFGQRFNASPARYRKQLREKAGG